MQTILKSYGLHHLLFALALGIYAAFSSPTPDDFGLAEISIFTLLLLSLRPYIGPQVISGLCFAAYGLSVPLIVALVKGYAINEIIRDVTPFLFLLMPVLYVGQGKPHFLLGLLIFIGIIFSVRSVQSFGADLFTPSEWLGTPPDLLYLANSPEVLFAGTALLCMAAQKNGSLKWRIFYVLLSILPLIAMATLMQRASLFYEAGIILCLFLSMLWYRPRAAFGMMLVLLCAGFLAASFLGEIFHQLSFKTQMVGLNSRGAEWQAVFEQIDHSPSAFLFGKGWGAEFENPAVGGLRVSFTHSLLSSLFLKTGMAGVIIFLIYGWNLFKSAWPELKRDTLYLYALSGPLLIGLCLYASYKSLGYGLLLLLLSSLIRLDDRQEAVP